MFNGFSHKTIDFMWNIRFNNNKEWFVANKKDYKSFLEKPMNELAQEVYRDFALKHEELNLQLHVSRIYRDARRLYGKGPYKDHLWFTLRYSYEQWTDKPVFWFELSPEELSYGLGYYRARSATMENLRNSIDTAPEQLVKLDLSLREQTEFVLEGEEYTRSKCSLDNPLAHWYNKKTFSLIHEEKIGLQVFKSELKDKIVEGFTFLIPFYKYFISLDQSAIDKGDYNE